MERAELVKLGKSGRPEVFIAAAARTPALHDDPGVRFLLAGALERLGLPELARRTLSALAGAAADAPPVVDLRARIEGKPQAMLDLTARVERLDAARSALSGKTPDDMVGRAHAAAVQNEPGFEVHLGADGTEIRCPRGAAGLSEWSGPWSAGGGDALARLEPLGVENAAPITVEGMVNAATLVELAKRTPACPSGFHRGLHLVEPDPAAVFEAAVRMPACVDVIASARTRCFFGRDAGPEFAAFLASRQTLSAIGPLVGIPTAANAARVLQAAATQRESATVRLRAEAARTDAERSVPEIARRFDRRVASGGLRVLVPTCRFSTYVRHSSALLVEALRRAGHEAELLIEPDASTNMLDAAYLDACARFDPDLVVLINYPRAARPDWFPRSVPFVCWIQDHMPHLYDEAVARAQGPLDFTAGHVPRELYFQLGYPPERAMASPVVVDAGTFFRGDVSGAHRERFACDLAYVSHQSEPFEAMVERLAVEAGPAGGVVRGLEPVVRAAVDRLATEAIGPTLRDAVQALLRTVPSIDSPANRARFLQSVAMPMAERLVRHRTLEWAAELTDEDGLDLRLFGNGWEAHPTLSRFSAGGVEHGEELRACHACARLQLHPTVRAMTHQRVLECALSGGMPLISFYEAALPPDRAIAFQQRLDPATGRPGSAPGTVVFSRADVPELVADGERRARLGLEMRPEVEVDVAWLEERLAEPEIEGQSLAVPATLFPEMRPYVYLGRDDFRERVRALLASDAERERLSSALAARAAGAYTMDAFVRRLVSFVGRGLIGAVERDAADVVA